MTTVSPCLDVAADDRGRRSATRCASATARTRRSRPSPRLAGCAAPASTSACSASRSFGLAHLDLALGLVEGLAGRQLLRPQLALAGAGSRATAPGSRAPRRRCCAAARAAIAPRRGRPRCGSVAVRWLRGSICIRNWPFLTCCPSSTASSTTRPIVSALMLTVVRAWILPEAETMASRSRVCTFSSGDRLARRALHPDVAGDGAAEQDDRDDADDDFLPSGHLRTSANAALTAPTTSAMTSVDSAEPRKMGCVRRR